MDALTQLQWRLAHLEAGEAIRALKHRYLRACDDKDPVAMRACFVPEGAHIHYDRIGSFNSGEALAQCFAELGCRPSLLEMHFAGHADIVVEDAGLARGTWDLAYLGLDQLAGISTSLTGRYADEYALVDGVWLIRSTVFTTRVLTQGSVPVGSRGGSLGASSGAVTERVMSSRGASRG